MYWQISSHIQWIAFLFCWWFPLLCKTFFVWCSPICLFFSFVFLAWGDVSDKLLLQAMSKILLIMFLLIIGYVRIFMVSGLTFKSLIYFKFILVCGIIKWSSFIFLYHLSNFSNTTYWINWLLPILCACFLCQILIDYKGMGLFLASLFCSIDLSVCFYASTMLFWLLWTCSIVWYQVPWFLQLWSSFSRLLLLFRGFCGSI